MPDDPLAPLLSRPRPETLFHYTSPAGTLGILSSREVWASSIHFLNDAREFQQAREVATQELWSLSRNSSHPQASEIVRLIGESLERVSRVNICVFSLSERENLLSQWRAYCRRGGYSLGFNVEELVQVATGQGFTLVPCVYRGDEQRALLRPITTHVFDRFLTELETTSEPLDKTLEKVVGHFFEQFARVAPAIKHPAFAEEAEWRLVSLPLRDDEPRIRHRATEGLLIPYYRLSIETKSGVGVRLDHTVVGPSPHPMLATDAFGSLLTSTHTPWRGFSPSHIPFREI